MKSSVNALKNRIRASRREIPSDLVLKGGRVVNVFSGSIEEGDVALYEGMIAGVGRDYHGKKEISLEG
ncbi:MAG: adenine deaminase, partial [Pseudomonadota bacterium]